MSIRPLTISAGRSLVTPVRPPQQLHRIYRTATLSADGHIMHASHKLPALAELDQTCAGFARGTLIETPEGPRAIEDLNPGNRVTTADGHDHIFWIGNMVWVPVNDTSTYRQGPLQRLMVSQIAGFSPYQDLLLGSGARVWQSRPGGKPVLRTPASIFGEDALVEITPPGSVELFHIMLAHESQITANGMTFASCQTSIADIQAMPRDLQRSSMQLFPHLADMLVNDRVRRPATGGLPGL